MAVVNKSTGDGYPAFQLEKPRFDQSTFAGRYRHLLDLIDPRTLFTSKAKLSRCVGLLKQFEDGTLPPGITNKELWQALKVKQSILHPDTGEKIYMPFRMSGFVPFGSITVIGVLLPNPTTFQMVFWQWLNQTHNAAFNYSNRNATKPTPTSRFVLGYAGAVTSAVSIAVGLSFLIKRANSLSPTMKIIVQRFVPFPAVATASVSNVVLMRNSELSTGIEVVDGKGKVIGTSQVAAKQALLETAATRAFLPVPIMVLTPVIMTLLEKTRWLRKNPRLYLPLNSVVATMTFAFALPLAIAMFPQESQIKRQKLEASLQNATDDEILYYNKGL